MVYCDIRNTAASHVSIYVIMSVNGIRYYETPCNSASEPNDENAKITSGQATQ